MNSSTSTATLAGNLADFAEPPTNLMDAPALDYFFIEMVNTLRHSSAVAISRTKKIEQEMADAGLMPVPTPAPTTLKKSQLRESIASNASRSSLSKDVKEEDEEEELRSRLESIGMHVGANIAERYVPFTPYPYRIPSTLRYSLCHERGLFSDTLDAIKFICKDLWSTCWEKQVDNLRTNHRVRTFR